MYMAYRAPDLYPGARFAVAHCNFSLRGAESDGDEAFVREWCAARGTTCHVRRFDTAACAAGRGISTEMAARELRYAWFGELCTEYGYDNVVVAHNANDNAETLMLNLLRGTGLRGICGMGERAGILRPLLNVERTEILAWMSERGYVWREDRTNSESIYKRNILRNEVFPAFGRINPSFIRSLGEDMDRFSQAEAIVEDYFREAEESVVLDNGDISISGLMELKHWEYVLWRLLENSGIRKGEFESLKDLLRSGRQTGGKRFGVVTAGSDRIRIAGTQAERELVCEIIGRNELDSLKQPEGTLIADADKLPVPLRIRRWKEGDWMKPFGMNGHSRKISDMLNEYKLTPDEKEAAEVIELDGPRIAALPCRRIDESVKVDGSTEKVLRMRYRKI